MKLPGERLVVNVEANKTCAIVHLSHRHPCHDVKVEYAALGMHD
jgi:hypothetical protein